MAGLLLPPNKFVMSQNSIKRAIFQKVHGGNLVYNTCWEDPRCDRALLGLDAQSQVVMISSAGCNALDYLLDDPKAVHCIDMNPRQNALLDLKLSLFKNVSHRELYDFFGNGMSDQANDILNDALLQDLESYAVGYWKRNIGFFSGKGIRNSFYAHGSAGLVAFAIRKILATQPLVKKAVMRLLECEDQDMQRVLYLRIEPFMLNNVATWLMKRHLVQSMLGIPESQQRLVNNVYPDGLKGYLRACLRHVFIGLPFTDNYFWRLYLLGRYEPQCCPNYLKKEHFDTLQARTGRVHLHTSTISQFLLKNPGKYTHFILLDHQDWLAANDRPALKEEWDLILKNAAPGAKVLMRSAASKLDFLPREVEEALSFDLESTAAQHRLDRVGTYASVHLGSIKANA
jgi:S-adenosylmethionine-diacylglycerol 3-amino-3-carboxypropyl transferase